MTGAAITQILSALKAFPEVGYMANVTGRSKKRNRKPRNFFMIRNPGSHLRPGVYEKLSSGAIKPILIFINNPQYTIRLRFFDVIEKAISKNIQRRFNDAVSRASSVRF
jgi:hypothetical protein